MSVVARLKVLCLVAMMAGIAAPVMAQGAGGAGQTIRVVGTVRDQANAITLPGVPVEVVGTGQIVYTDVDGRYTLNLPPGTHTIKVLLEGYQERQIKVETGAQRTMTLDVGLTMNSFAGSPGASSRCSKVSTPPS